MGLHREILIGSFLCLSGSAGVQPTVRNFIVQGSALRNNTQSLMNRLKRIIDCNPSRNLTFSMFFNTHFDKVIFYF